MAKWHIIEEKSGKLILSMQAESEMFPTRRKILKSFEVESLDKAEEVFNEFERSY